MKTLIISMLSLMLVITVVFTSFGIAYNRNDFVSLVVDVEHRAGSFSTWCIEEYKVISTGLQDTITRLQPLLDLLGDAANALLDFFNSKVISWIVDVSNYIGGFFKFVSTYGINFFDAKIRSAFHCWFANLLSFVKSNGVPDYDTLMDFVNHFVFGDVNQFTYLHLEWSQTAKKILAERTRCDSTVLISDEKEANENTSTFYFYCPSLRIPRDFAVGIDDLTRARIFFGDSYEFPCGSSNLRINVDGNLYAPAYIKVSFDSEYGVSVDGVVYSIEMGFIINNSVVYYPLINPEYRAEQASNDATDETHIQNVLDDSTLYSGLVGFWKRIFGWNYYSISYFDKQNLRLVSGGGGHSGGLNY